MTQTKDRQDADMSTDTADRKAIAAVEGTAPTPYEPALPDEAPAEMELGSLADAEQAADAPATNAPAVDVSAPLPADDAAAEPPLLDSELEDGIASIFAALHSATPHALGDSADDAEIDDADLAAMLTFGEPDDDTGDPGEAFDTSTFRLLGELDRLWHRAA